MDSVGGIYTIGYENLRIDQFVNKLRDSKITAVVDVRLTPSSRRPGFSKKSLAQALRDAGITYVHEKDLGNPPDNREAFRKGPLAEGRRRMRERIENGAGDALRRLVQRAEEERVAVLCVEWADKQCHRQVIVEMAEEIEPGIFARNIW